MLTDRYGMTHAVSDGGAVAAFEAAVLAVAAHRPGADPALSQALATEPDFVAAHALRGLARVLLAREETMLAARTSLDDAQMALARSTGTASERALVEALSLAVRGRWKAAADRLAARLDQSPREFLLVKLAHALRFMAGDAAGMMMVADRAVMAADPQSAGYGFLLGCQAFGLEEAGAYEAAERIGRQAVALQPADAWGIHAVGHVYEMTGQRRAGIDWLEAHRPSWSGCNNFAFHVSWHVALFHLEGGDADLVLDLYDREIRPRPTDDFRDMANAVSLLCRLEQSGVDVGDRWEEVATIAEFRRRDRTLIFASLHNLLALLATGRHDLARELVAAHEIPAIAGSDQAAVQDSVGRELMRILSGLDQPALAPGEIGALVRALPAIGGSMAQRDVFLRTLACMSADAGDRAGLDCQLDLRRTAKTEDRFVEMVRARLARHEARRRRLIA